MIVHENNLYKIKRRENDFTIYYKSSHVRAYAVAKFDNGVLHVGSHKEGVNDIWNSYKKEKREKVINDLTENKS